LQNFLPQPSCIFLSHRLSASTMFTAHKP
jgi:hypothetical protein